MAALYLRPDADQSDGGWLNEAASATNIFASVDESTLSDTDYIVSSTTDGDKVRLRLSDPSSGVAAPFIVRYRCKRTGTQAANLIGRLYQGTGPGTLITTFTQLSVPDTFTTYTYTLTSGEFTSITDFTDLYVEFELSQQSSLKVDLNFAAGNYYDSGTVADATGVLSCVRASTAYAVSSAGLLTSFAVNTLRITDLGLLMETTSRTNSALWCRDLTNAVWTKTNVTAALDQTGVDGGSNTASSILANAGNGTVLQTTTVGSSARWQSAYVKRITGTGTINMTMDGGSTWTAITVTSSWARVEIPTQTLANPTVGFRIVTSGDKIAVDFVQNEDTANGLYASSPILTTTGAATRAADAITCTGNLSTALDGSAASLVADVKKVDLGLVWDFFINNGAYQYVLLGSDNSLPNTGIMMKDDTVGNLFASPIGNSLTWTGGAKGGFSFSSGGRSVVGGGGSVGTDANVPTFFTPKTVGTGGGANCLYRRITVWNSRLADATLQALTAP